MFGSEIPIRHVMFVVWIIPTAQRSEVKWRSLPREVATFRHIRLVIYPVAMYLISTKRFDDTLSTKQRSATMELGSLVLEESSS